MTLITEAHEFKGKAVITRDVFHRSVGFYTHLMTFSGAGAVMGALVVAWLGKNKHMGRILLILLVLFGTIIMGFGMSRRVYLSALILFSGRGRGMLASQ